MEKVGTQLKRAAQEHEARVPGVEVRHVVLSEGGPAVRRKKRKGAIGPLGSYQALFSC